MQRIEASLEELCESLLANGGTLDQTIMDRLDSIEDKAETSWIPAEEEDQ